MMFPGWGMGGWSMVLFGLISIAAWGLLVIGIVTLMRSSRQSGGPLESPAPPSAQELLAQRYARGEIDEDEYRHRLEVIKASVTMPQRGL